jgi:hypothetical protein
LFSPAKLRTYFQLQNNREEKLGVRPPDVVLCIVASRRMGLFLLDACKDCLNCSVVDGSLSPKITIAKIMN